LAALKPKGETAKKTIGTRLLGGLLKSSRDALQTDPHATISANFSALTIALKQRREVVERRATAIQSKSGALQTLCGLIEIYKDEIDEALQNEQDPIKSNDLGELKQIFAINAIAAHSGSEGIISAVSSEKKAFLALQKTANVIPLLASSLIQAINKMRAQQTNAMLSGAEETTQIMLEDLSGQAKGIECEADLSISGVFEMADKQIGLIQDHVKDAGQHSQESDETIQRSALAAQEHLTNS